MTKTQISQHGPVAIIGASFAGLACASALAEHGVETIVIDRKHPSEEVRYSTGVLVRDVVDEFDWLGDLPPDMARRAPGVRLYAPDMDSVDIDAPGYDFLAVDSPALMRFLINRCTRDGVKFRTGEAFVGAHPTLAGWKLGGGLEASYIVGADGAHSHVAKSLGLGQNKRFVFGVSYEYPIDLPESEDRLHCFLDRRLAPGYAGWAVAGANAVQIGLARRLSDASAAKQAMADFVKKIAPIIDFRKRAPAETRTGLIPCGGLVAPLSRPHALLIGDAAGMASPITAGGLHAALRHGHAAGSAIAAFLLGRGEDPALWLPDSYPRSPERRKLRFLFDHFQSDMIINMALRTKTLHKAAEEIFFHQAQRS